VENPIRQEGLALLAGYWTNFGKAVSCGLPLFLLFNIFYIIGNAAFRKKPAIDWTKQLL